MRKTGWKFFSLIFVAVLLFLWIIKAPILSEYLSRKLGVKVSVGSVQLGKDHMKMTRFSIQNPKGFLSRTAFNSDLVEIHYAWDELKEDPSLIDKVEIADAVLDLEFLHFPDKENNWTAILENRPDLEKPRHVLVKKLILENVRVKVTALGSGQPPQTKVIPYMELDDIDSEEGFPMQEILSGLFEQAGMVQYIQQIRVVPRVRPVRGARVYHYRHVD